METKEVRFEHMRPGELEALIAEKPLAWIPFGTLEWHGRHLPVGLDAIKAHDICVRAAQAAGGAVLPAAYFSPWGMAFPWTFKYSAVAFARYVRGVFRNLDRYGFKAMILVTGHYPGVQAALLMAMAEAYMAARPVSIAAAPEFAFCAEAGYFGDHAAKWETSFMQALRPDLVDDTELGALRGDSWFGLFRKGVNGKNPARYASPELGREAVDLFVLNSGKLAEELLGQDGRKAARRFHRKSASAFFSHHTKNVFEFFM